MLLTDFNAVVQWWFTLFLLGVGFLPLTAVLFRNFFDKGYIFAKLIGLAMTGYVVFLFGLLHITSFTLVSSYIIFAFLVAGSLLLIPKKKHLLTSLKPYFFIFAMEELLFFSLLLFWAYIHSFGPDIHGLEKYMDYGFINSLLRTEYFPPKDMWFTPFTINYYYFGHLLTALLIKLSNLPPQIAFNLMLSTIFAFCFTQTFSLGANLYAILKKNEKIVPFKLLFSGFLTACLATLSGNLHIVYAFFKPYKAETPVPFWELAFNPAGFPNSYWYPNATRFIHNTIHEFPIYSWVVADLHGHVLDIPFVLLMIALLLSFFMKYPISNIQYPINTNDHRKFKLDIWNWKLDIRYLIMIGFLLSVMYMTNAWDGGIYMLLTILVIFAIYWQKIETYKKRLEWATHFIISVLSVIIAFVVFTTPYNIFFQVSKIVSGVGVLCSPDFLVKIGKIGPFLFEANHCQHSYLWELLTLYGFFYFFVLSFVFFSFKLKKYSPTDIFVFLLIILSTVLIILPEFFYIKDIYPAHYRANTMFKLVFQAFIMLSICTGYIIVRIVSTNKFMKLRWHNKILAACFILLTSLLLALVMIYPYLAVKSYYGDLKTYRGLDGTRYLQTLYPSDYAGILWLNTSVKGQPVILEAQGDSYTDYARVSANTGLPTVLGWTVHEWLWRGTYDVSAPRITEIANLYESSNEALVKSLLQKHNISYVFIGAMEHEKYPKLDEEKFKKFGKIVFKKGTTKIYKIN